jgi:hypothetical protein
MDYQTPQWDKIFRNLLVDMRDQQCVLLLGPEIIRKGNVSLTRFMYEFVNRFWNSFLCF